MEEQEYLVINGMSDVALGLNEEHRVRILQSTLSGSSAIVL